MSLSPPCALQTGSSSSSSSKVPHSSATSRLKHLQQGSPEKNKPAKQRDDFLKVQGQPQPTDAKLLENLFSTGQLSQG
ncbi:SRC kinase signaling inhibitor 1-like [Arapaima gigas]